MPVKIKDFNLPDENVQYDINFIRKNLSLLLEHDIEKKKCVVGITEKTSDAAKKNIREFHKNDFPKIEFAPVEEKELLSWLEDFSNSKNEEAAKEISFNEGTVANLLNTIFSDALKKKASDIHIESGEKNAFVRFRIDGQLEKTLDLNMQTFSTLSSRIKVIANLNILEKRLPQDGRISFEYENKKIEFRVSIVPQITGESIVLRILGNNSEVQNIENLGFSENQLCSIKSLLKNPEGLILLTGPTGSGKSTTLNAMINFIKDDSKKIISIEDPVEYKNSGVTQIQIDEQIGLTFNSILRRILRQDPNVILVGEIRDKETAELCVKASLTGHLVFSTLHTNDAVSAVDRLFNMGIERYLISAVLKGVIAQRLVRKLDRKTETFKGRTLLSEVFACDENIKSFILENDSYLKIKNYLTKNKIPFLKDDAEEKIKLSVTTKEEVEKEIKFD